MLALAFLLVFKAAEIAIIVNAWAILVCRNICQWYVDLENLC